MSNPSRPGEPLSELAQLTAEIAELKIIAEPIHRIDLEYDVAARTYRAFAVTENGIMADGKEDCDHPEAALIKLRTRLQSLTPG